MPRLFPFWRRPTSCPIAEAATATVAATTAAADTVGVITGACERSSTPPSLTPAGRYFPGAFLSSATALPTRSSPRRVSGITTASTDNVSTASSVHDAEFGLRGALLVAIFFSGATTTT